MKNIKQILGAFILLLSVNMLAFNVVPQLQDDRTRVSVRRQREASRKQQKSSGKEEADTTQNKPLGLSALTLEDESIPDSLLHPRWKVQRTTPVTLDDTKRRTADLGMPDNIKQDVVYNDTLDRYFVGSKLGGGYLSTPIMMTPEEYRKWSE